MVRDTFVRPHKRQAPVNPLRETTIMKKASLIKKSESNQLTPSTVMKRTVQRRNHAVNERLFETKLVSVELRMQDVPSPTAWTCPETVYNNLDGCDCNCGYPDPDCITQSDIIFGCSANEICDNARCIPWTCNAAFYDNLDGCDCGCGFPDPDCEVQDFVFGYSDPNAICFNAECFPSTSTTPAGPPSAWTCSDGFFDSNDGCDCNCGFPDPDCVADQTSTFGCSANEVCDNDQCIPWTCSVLFYETSDGCDCGCGFPDPDCFEQPDLLFGCSDGDICFNGECISSDITASPSFASPTVPPDWFCPLDFFNSSDGCDCDCGFPDPDCISQPDVVFGCPPGHVCFVDKCVDPLTVPDENDLDTTLVKVVSVVTTLVFLILIRLIFHGCSRGKNLQYVNSPEINPSKPFAGVAPSNHQYQP